MAVAIGVLYLASEQNRQPIERTSTNSEASSAGRNQDAQQQGGGATQAPQVTEPQIGAPIGTAPTDQEATENNSQTDQEARELMRRDVAAQVGMMYAAWAAVLLTGVGIFLIWRNLVHTRTAANAAQQSVSQTHRAVIAARYANSIASRAAKDARESAKCQLRAYVLPDRHNVDLGSTDLFEPRYPVVRVVLKNSGNTPARQVRYQFLVDVQERGKRDFDISENSLLIGRDIGPGQEFPLTKTLAVQNVFETRADDLNKFTHILYAYGALKYVDVFNESHTTKFCFLYNPITGGMTTNQWGNEAD